MCVPGYVYIYICARVGFIKKNDPKSSAQEAIFKSRLGEGTRSNVNRLGFLLSSSHSKLSLPTLFSTTTITTTMASKIEHIVVNAFMFCAAHGDEYCQMCCCDHRMRNNVTIEDELGDMSEFLGFEVEVSGIVLDNILIVIIDTTSSISRNDYH